MAQKRPRADDSVQTPAPERYSRQRRSHDMRKLPPQKDSTTEATNPFYVRVKSFATSIFTSGVLLGNFLSNSLADTSEDPTPTLENASATLAKETDELDELYIVAESSRRTRYNTATEEPTEDKANGLSTSSAKISSIQSGEEAFTKQLERSKRKMSSAASEQDIKKVSTSIPNHDDNRLHDQPSSIPESMLFSTPISQQHTALTPSINFSISVPHDPESFFGTVNMTSTPVPATAESEFSYPFDSPDRLPQRKNSVSTLNSVQNGRVQKKRPIRSLNKSQESRKRFNDLLQNYANFEEASEKGYRGLPHEWPGLVNYARQAFQASQAVERRQLTPHTLNRMATREVIEIEDDEVLDRSQLLRNSLRVYRTPAKGSPMRSPSLSSSFTSDDRSSYIDGLWDANPRRTFEPKSPETKLEEPAWLTQLRTVIESAINPQGKVETPKYDSLKKKTESITQEIEARRKPKSDNFPILSPEARTLVANTFLRQKMEPIAQFTTATVRLDDIKTLRDGQWLNDEVINYYMTLINERSKLQNAKYPKVHCFNTFFYPNLVEGYQKVKRWTKKIDIFEKDYIIIPVHLGIHWCCAVINFVKHRFEYYDSLHGNNSNLHKILRDYIEQESLDKKKVVYDLSDWEDYAPKNCPHQENGYDCGVFASTIAEYVSREEQFDFGQRHMRYIRERMIYEIITSRLMDRPVKNSV